jgi:hypothetical protein
VVCVGVVLVVVPAVGWCDVEVFETRLNRRRPCFAAFTFKMSASGKTSKRPLSS